MVSHYTRGYTVGYSKGPVAERNNGGGIQPQQKQYVSTQSVET